MMLGSEPFTKRIQKELEILWADPPDFCRPGASPVTDILHWEVVIDGPDGSPYAGGTFPVDIDFVGNYPQKPPKITFKTKVYHPNISSEGELMLDIFHYKNWRLAMTVDKLLLYVVSVLYDPVLDCDPINEDVADVYEADLELYEETARAWTWEYSSTPIVSHHYPAKKDRSRSRRPRYHNDDELAAAIATCSAYERGRLLEPVAPEPRGRGEILERRHDDDASSTSPAAHHETTIGRVPLETWKSVVAFLRRCCTGVALPFPTFRRRFSSTLLPLYHYRGPAHVSN